MTQKLVIIGNGMAPGRMLENLFETAPGLYDVTIFNAEPRVNYDRIMLSPVLSGEKNYEDIIAFAFTFTFTSSCLHRLPAPVIPLITPDKFTVAVLSFFSQECSRHSAAVIRWLGFTTNNFRMNSFASSGGKVAKISSSVYESAVAAPLNMSEAISLPSRLFCFSFFIVWGCRPESRWGWGYL